MFPKRNLEKIVEKAAIDFNIEINYLADNWIILLKKNNKIKQIFGYNFDINSCMSKMNCDDKHACSLILSQYDIPNIPCDFFSIYVYLENDYDKLEKEVKSSFNKFNGNVVIKPNTGTSGNDVYHCLNEKDTIKYAKNLWKLRKDFIISPFKSLKNEFRVIVLNDQVELIYCKSKSTIIGDGKTTLIKLLKNKLKNVFEHDIISCIDKKYSPNYIIPKNETIVYSWKHNLKYGNNVSIDIDNDSYYKINNLALLAANSIKIKFASIDIVQDDNDNFMVLEMNAGVMLEKFSKQNDKFYGIAENIYTKAIKYMFDE